MRGKQKSLLIVGLAWLLSFSFVGVAVAATAQSSSSKYQVNEVFFGSGGALRNCSNNYCSKQSAGETVVGNTKSDSYQAQGGFNTDRTPFLEFSVSNTNLDLGTLSSGSTKTANASFSVKTYLASGYVVKQTSPGPTNGAFSLAGLTVPSVSAAGTEQFGINLVANTSPTTFGANPVQDPGPDYSFGQVANGYNTPNRYKYGRGDVIASSASSSGRTNYTISYIFNVSNLTAGGTYTLRHVLVATSTF